MDAVRSFGSLKLSHVVYREDFLANFFKQELRRWKECQWKTQICQIRLAADRHRPSTTKNFLALGNFLKQELQIWRECQWKRKTQICQLVI